MADHHAVLSSRVPLRNRGADDHHAGSPVKTPLEVLIIGGGIGGQTMALALHATGVPCRIRIREAAASLMPLGVGINLQPHAIRELAGLGLVKELRRVGIE